MGFLITRRDMCWNCYGEGVELESPDQRCEPCKGTGFIERQHSLAMALAAMNLPTPEEPEVLWVSHPSDGIANSGNRYMDIRVFASTPPSPTKSQEPYAIIINMRGRDAGLAAERKMLSTIELVMADFFSRYAISINEVNWLYRNGIGDLGRLDIDNNSGTITFSLITKQWSCSDFTIIGLPSIDNRLQLMVEHAAFLADSCPNV